MSNRFGRDQSRNSLFSTYDARSTSPSKLKSKPSPRSPLASPSYGYGYAPSASSPDPTHLAPGGSGFAAYPGAGSRGEGEGTFRSATPNSRGQYSSAVLDELESQNEQHVGVLMGKVGELKNLTQLIGAEIRDSSALAERMNDQFENSRLKIKGTMTRMLRMAEKTGIGWRVWLGFFAAVAVLFWYVWLF